MSQLHCMLTMSHATATVCPFLCALGGSVYIYSADHNISSPKCHIASCCAAVYSGHSPVLLLLPLLYTPAHFCFLCPSLLLVLQKEHLSGGVEVERLLLLRGLALQLHPLVPPIRVRYAEQSVLAHQLLPHGGLGHLGDHVEAGLRPRLQHHHALPSQQRIGALDGLELEPLHFLLPQAQLQAVEHHVDGHHRCALPGVAPAPDAQLRLLSAFGFREGGPGYRLHRRTTATCARLLLLLLLQFAQGKGPFHSSPLPALAPFRAAVHLFVLLPLSPCI
mmetsp:Transcript_24400/g.52832  ORF Transcript_24400/g.52832 Transcript_24400/m.52832 type:complete len:277 (-) Transcript_24400:1740-2570(-)